jgi:hypothetical protein
MDQRPLAARLEAWLLEPASAVRSVEERSRARLLALLTLGGIVAVSGAEAAFWHARDGHVLNWHAFVMLVPAYVFARRGRLRASALLTAYVLPVAALVRVSTGVAFHPLVPLTTLVLPPLVAAIVLRRRDVLILVAVEMVVPLVLVVLVPDAFPEPLVVAAPMALTFIAGVLVLAFMSHRDALERLRQQDLRAREARLRAWFEKDGELAWEGLGHLRTSEVGEVLERVVRRMERHLRRSGQLRTFEDEAEADRESDPEGNLAASAVSGQAPPAGPQWVSRLAPLEPQPLAYDKPLCASLDGFTLPAATRAGALDSAGREALLHYVLRPPVAQERVEQRPDGLVRITLKKDGEVLGRAGPGEPVEVASGAAIAPSRRRERQAG